MSDRSRIEWTDATWNPVRGCTKVSAGCKHCYAQTFSERFRGVPNHPFEQGFDLRLVPESLDIPTKWKKGRKIFVNSMSDLFHEKIPLSYIQEVFEVMGSCPQHRFQILTKRAKRLSDLSSHLPWHENIWMGVSIENHRFLNRANHLRDVPCSTRFLSLEPLLGPLNNLDLQDIDWVILGGESGSKSREVNAEWIRNIRDQCTRHDVPFFFKQWGGKNKKTAGRLLDGREWNDTPDMHDASRMN